MVQRAKRTLKTLSADLLRSFPLTREIAQLLVRTITRITSDQTTAASLTTVTLARAPGRIVGVRVMRGGAAAGAGESMTFQVTTPTGNTIALLTFSSASNTTADVFVQGVLAPANCRVLAGDAISVVRTYVAGGTPTPMTNTKVEVDIDYDV